MKNLSNVLAFAVVAVLVSACGSQSTRDSNSVSAAATTATNNVTNASPTNLPAAFSTDVQISGATGALPTYTKSISFSHTLKVKIKPLPAVNLQTAGVTNYVFPYGCLQVSVTVNGTKRSTVALRVEGMTPSPQCANAATFQVIDFSDLGTGAGNANVVISGAIYDNCRLNYSFYNPQFYYGCTMSQMYMTHMADMSVTIMNDQTYMDETLSQ